MESKVIEIALAETPQILAPSKFNEFHNIAQRGALNSLQSLERFLGFNIQTHINSLSFLPISLMTDRLNLFYSNSIGFHLRFSGDINGEIYTFFSEKDARSLIKHFLGCTMLKRGRRFNRIELSVLNELSNIVGNSFWQTFGNQSTLRWNAAPPVLVRNITSCLFYSSRIYSFDAGLLHVEFSVPDLKTRIQLLLLPTAQTLDNLISAQAEFLH